MTKNKNIYKSKAQLLKMSANEIAEYCNWLEKNDQIAKINGLEYIEWCEDELMEALDELNISVAEFEALLKEV